MPKLAVPPSAQPVMLKRVSTQKFQRPEQRNGPVPLRVKLLQGVGALPGQHKEWAFNTLLLIYYSQILGLPAGTAAAVLAVALIVDALTDPLVGALSDSYRSRFGRRHPFMFMSVIPTTLSAFALFAPPPELSYTSLTVWMLLATLGLRVSYTLFVVPWGAVAAELSEDYNERTSIITYRMAVGWIGGVLFIFGAYTYVFPSGPTDENGLMQAANYLLFAWVLSGLMLAYILITSFGTLGQSRYLPQPTAQLPAADLGCPGQSQLSTAVRSDIDRGAGGWHRAGIRRLHESLFLEVQHRRHPLVQYCGPGCDSVLSDRDRPANPLRKTRPFHGCIAAPYGSGGEQSCVPIYRSLAGQR